MANPSRKKSGTGRRAQGKDEASGGLTPEGTVDPIDRRPARPLPGRPDQPEQMRLLDHNARACRQPKGRSARLQVHPLRRSLCARCESRWCLRRSRSRGRLSGSLLRMQLNTELQERAAPSRVSRAGPSSLDKADQRTGQVETSFLLSPDKGSQCPSWRPDRRDGMIQVGLNH